MPQRRCRRCGRDPQLFHAPLRYRTRLLCRPRLFLGRSRMCSFLWERLLYTTECVRGSSNDCCARAQAHVSAGRRSGRIGRVRFTVRAAGCRVRVRGWCRRQRHRWHRWKRRERGSCLTGGLLRREGGEEPSWRFRRSHVEKRLVSHLGAGIQG